MKELYTSPEVEMIEFNTVDVITTSGELDSLLGAASNEELGWTDFY